jgi:transposase
MIYSVDLRKRAVEAVQQGMTLTQAEKTFKITRKAIATWIKRLEKNGHLNPETGYQKGHSHKITDWVLFDKFANENKLLTALQMVPKWKELTGTDLSETTIVTGLKKINFTSKKKRFLTSKAIKKNKEYSQKN